MDVASLASALVAAQLAQAQLAMAARLARMDAQTGQSVATLLDAAQQNAGRVAGVAAGIGTQVDITA